MTAINGNLDQQVKPLHPITPKLYKLSTIDQYVPKRWITRMMYFPLPSDTPPAEVYNQLKLGLSRVVTIHPQLTGRVCRQPDRPHWAAVQTSEDSSVDFTFRDHTASSGEGNLPSYARLKELGFPMQGMVSTACPPVMQYEVSEGTCIFAAQANFIEGGLLLASAANHVCIDGGWWNELFKLWAEHTNNDSTTQATEAIEYPTNVVEQLSTPTSSQTPPDPLTWIVGDTAKSTFYMAPPNTPASGVIHPKKQPANGTINSTTKPPLGSQLRIWTITPSQQAELKATAKAYSTMDSIFSLMWNRAATHSHAHRQNHCTSYARIPIDMRARLDPPVSSAYMGNTVAMLTTSLPTPSLSGPISDTLPQICTNIRATIKSYTQRDFESFIGTANSLPADKALVYPFNSVFTPTMLLNDHSKMGIMSYDFGGQLGRVERLRDAMDDLPVRHLNVCLVLPKLVDGTLEVLTLFDHEVNSALEKDEDFLKFFGRGGDGMLWVV